MRLGLHVRIGFWEERRQSLGSRAGLEGGKCAGSHRLTASFTQGYRLCRKHGKGVLLTFVKICEHVSKLTGGPIPEAQELCRFEFEF